MKKLLLITCLLTSFSSLAEGKKWELRRDFRVGHMGKRISMLQSGQSCFKSAGSRDEFKKCRESLKPQRAVLKAEGQAFREKMKASRKNRKK
jgi:hypothetical protein